MARRDPAQLLAAARLELARRGDPTWAPVLRRFEREFGRGAGRPPALPSDSQLESAEALEAALRALSAEQRRALRRVLDELAAPGPPRADADAPPEGAAAPTTS